MSKLIEMISLFTMYFHEFYVKKLIEYTIFLAYKDRYPRWNERSMHTKI